MWVTVSIYLTVIGWAYAIGSLLALLQDRAFRQALALQHFTRKVAPPRRAVRADRRLRAHRRAARSLAGPRWGGGSSSWTSTPSGSTAWSSTPTSPTCPVSPSDARDPGTSAVAGLDHPSCEAVVALTDDEEANLAVVMAAALLRPDVPVIARVTSRSLAQRMQEFGNPALVNPFDRFGDHLRLALKAPASYQLLTWLESGPGEPLPERGHPPHSGRWVVCGYGRLGRELTADLRAEGLEVTVIDPDPGDPDDEGILVGDGSDPWVMAQADLDRAVGFVAGTDNDTTNLSLVAAARRANPRLFLGARQNRAASAPLFAAMGLDALLVPSEVIAHEIYAQLSTPLLWRFLREMPQQGDAWAQQVIDRLGDLCGERLQALWKVRLTRDEAPALVPRLGQGVRLGDLLRNPENRDEPLHAVVLLVLRGSETTLAPGDDFELAAEDELLLAGLAGRTPRSRHDPLRRRRPRVRDLGTADAVELALAEAEPGSGGGERRTAMTRRRRPHQPGAGPAGPGRCGFPGPARRT